MPRNASHRIIFYDAPVFLNDVMCTGNEESILNCTETGYGAFDDCMSVAVAQCEGEIAIILTLKYNEHCIQLYISVGLPFMELQGRRQPGKSQGANSWCYPSHM